MKKLIFPFAILFITVITSCSSKNCKECTNCLTKSNTELCEDDFETASDYNDKIDDMVSDGCSCTEK